MKYSLIFGIFVYLLSYWNCQKKIAASDKQLRPCIEWAKSRKVPIPKKPSFIEFYIVSIAYSFKFPFWIIIKNLQFSKEVKYYEREMKLIFEKWNLEKHN